MALGYMQNSPPGVLHSPFMHEQPGVVCSSQTMLQPPQCGFVVMSTHWPLQHIWLRPQLAGQPLPPQAGSLGRAQTPLQHC